MKRFKLQILGALLFLIIFIIIVLVSFSYNSFQKESVSLNREVAIQKSLIVQAEINQKIKLYEQLLSGIKVTEFDFSENNLSSRLSEQLITLFNMLGPITDSTATFRKDGAIYNRFGEKLDINAKDKNRSYYDGIFNKGKEFFISSPFKAGEAGKEVLGMAYKLDNSTAVLSNIYLEKVLENVLKRTDTFIYTSNGTILVSPSPELLGKNIFEIHPSYKEFNLDVTSQAYNSILNDKVTSLTGFWGGFTDIDWKYVVFIENHEIEKAADSQLILSIVFGVFSLIIATIVLLFAVNKLIIYPLGGAPREMVKLIKEMAEGNLTQNSRSKKQETGIYFYLLHLSTNFTKLIKDSHLISENVFSASDELKKTMNETQSNAEKEQAQVEQISTAIHELSATSQEVSDKALRAEEGAKKAQMNVTSGQETLEKNIILTNDINTSVSNTAKIIEELKQFSEEIGSVVDVINGISEQTNLLALNAAIEAARAGEQGRGFSVVADEVRSLASKTQQSTISIKELIERLQTQSEKANSNMTENVELIKESVMLTDKVKVSFEDISAAVKSISDINALVATASQEQFHVTEDISKNATEAFDLVQYNVKAANQSLESIYRLTKLAEEQKDKLSFFKV